MLWYGLVLGLDVSLCSVLLWRRESYLWTKSRVILEVALDRKTLDSGVPVTHSILFLVSKG